MSRIDPLKSKMLCANGGPKKCRKTCSDCMIIFRMREDEVKKYVWQKAGKFMKPLLLVLALALVSCASTAPAYTYVFVDQQGLRLVRSEYRPQRWLPGTIVDWQGVGTLRCVEVRVGRTVLK